MIGWLTIEQVQELWLDAPDDDVLVLLNAASIAQLEAYAPATDVVPESWKYAQLMHIRNLWNAGRVAPGGDVGDEGFVFTPLPMSWEVKQIIRPRRALGVTA